MGRSTEEETGLSEQRKYRSWTAQQKLEIVLAGLRGDRSVREVCREHAIKLLDALNAPWTSVDARWTPDESAASALMTKAMPKQGES